MADYYVNGNQTAGVFDKLPLDTVVTMTAGSNIVDGVFGSPVSGNTVQIAKSVSPAENYETYEITSVGPPRIHENWLYANGDYKLRYGHGNGQSELNAFPTIFSALTNAFGNDRVFIKRIDAGYLLTRAAQSLRALTPRSGVILQNKFLRIKGYNTVIHDMSFGGSFYESAFSALRAGAVDPTKKVVVDGDDALASLLTLDNADNIRVEDIGFTGSTSDVISVANTPTNNIFKNCAFYDTYSMINEGSTTCPGIRFEDCFLTGLTKASGNIFKLKGVGATFIHNVFEFPGEIVIGINAGINVAGPSIVLISNLFLNSGIPISLKGDYDIIGNTIYNSAEAAIDVNANVEVSIGYAFNNIIIPKYHDASVAYRMGGGASDGGSISNDFNCLYGADGQPLDNIAVSGGLAGMVLPALGNSSIEANPLFVDVANKDFRIVPGSPCINTGQKCGLDSYSNMGAFRNKQLTRQRLNHA